MNAVLNMAGLNIEVESIYRDLVRSASGYIGDRDAVDFKVTTSEDEIRKEAAYNKKEFSRVGNRSGHISVDEAEFSLIHRKIAQELPRFDAVVFHGSAVAVGDTAFLFTAKSGTGKTTHTNLWLENIDGSYIVNGDKPIIRMIDGKVSVCGTPWMGKEGLGKNAVVPLKAICIVRRSKENSIKRLSFSEAASEFISQAYRSPEPAVLADTLSLLKRIGSMVEFYELHCNTDPSAAILAYNGMKNE